MVNKKTNVIVTMSLAFILLFGAVTNVSAADQTTQEDKTKPVLEYAYVEDERLILSISDDEELDDEPIVYKIDNESRSWEIDLDDYEYEYDGKKKMGEIYEINIEIPSSIAITIRDAAGNETAVRFSIKEDYMALTKNVPDYVLERLAEGKQSKVDKIQGYSNIFELEYGKVANSFDLFKQFINKSYYSYSKEDIVFKISGLSTDKEGNIQLNNFGVFKVEMTHNKDKTFKETAYIIVKPDWREPKEARVLNNLNPYIVYNENIKVADYFGYADEASNSKKKSKIDTTYLLVHNENTGETVDMNDPIKLELNQIYKLTVLNFEDDSKHDFYVMRQEKVKSQKGNFTDLPKNYWASKYINSLVSDGLLSGYSDGTFKPTKKITVKEFMAVLSRQIANAPETAKPVLGDVTLSMSSSSWGYIETKSIADRLSPSARSKFNFRNLNRPINRGEVVFLLDHALELGTPYMPNKGNAFTDINTSDYSREIKKLSDLGIINGYTDMTFRPYHAITRAEVASIFSKLN